MTGMTNKLTLAFDQSNRHFDKDGRLHVEKSNISKATVNKYQGKEIPGWDELGLMPDKIYYMLRDPKELEKGKDTFKGNQILLKHEGINADDPKKDLVIGCIGSDIKFEDPYLTADLCFWDKEFIDKIESDDVRDLSCSYYYKPIMKPGIFDGQKYDGIMTEIQGNHLALVPKGRAGRDVLVADADPFSKEIKMKTKKTNIAMDETEKELEENPEPQQMEVGDEEEKTEGTSGSRMQKLKDLLHEKVDAETLHAAMSIIADGESSDDEEYDSEKEDKEKKMGEDEKEDLEDKEKEKMTAKDIKTAMDSAVSSAVNALRKKLKEAEEAKRDVRSIVGDVLAYDSAPEVYKFALDHLRVDRKGVEGVPALRALFKAASSKTDFKPKALAYDSDFVKEKFPNMSRFR